MLFIGNLRRFSLSLMNDVVWQPSVICSVGSGPPSGVGGEDGPSNGLSLGSTTVAGGVFKPGTSNKAAIKLPPLWWSRRAVVASHRGMPVCLLSCRYVFLSENHTGNDSIALVVSSFCS